MRRTGQSRGLVAINGIFGGSPFDVSTKGLRRAVRFGGSMFGGRS